MNILAVHEADYINKVVFEYQIIPEILSSKGHSVYVIDFPVSWKRERIFDFGSLKTTYLYGVKKSNKSKGITLIRPGFIKIPILDRISAFIAYFFIINKIIDIYKIDAIVLFAVPNNGLQTLFWAKRYNIPILFRLLDVSHQIVPRKILKLPTYLIERYVYRKVNEIDAVTPRLANYAIYMGGKKENTFYTPTASDSDLFFPQKKNSELVKQYKIGIKETVLMFSGYLYNFSGLDDVIKSFYKNQKKYPNFKLIIVGDGTQKKYLASLIKKLNLQNKIVLSGFINYEKLPDYINLADICINTFHINKTTNIIFPSKIYQYLACGKPTIATKLQGLLDIFPDNGGKQGVYYFDINKPEGLFELAVKINRNKIINSNLSLQDIANKLETKLFKLIQ